MTLLMLLTILAIVTLPSIIWLYALADALINRFQTFTIKLVWLLVLCFIPPLGTVLYYLVGRSQRRTRYPVGRFVLVCILLFPIVMTILYYLQAPLPEPHREPVRPPASNSIQI